MRVYLTALASSLVLLPALARADCDDVLKGMFEENSGIMAGISCQFQGDEALCKTLQLQQAFFLSEVMIVGVDVWSTPTVTIRCKNGDCITAFYSNLGVDNSQAERQEAEFSFPIFSVIGMSDGDKARYSQKLLECAFAY